MVWQLPWWLPWFSLSASDINAADEFHSQYLPKTPNKFLTLNVARGAGSPLGFKVKAVRSLSFTDKCKAYLNARHAKK